MTVIQNLEIGFKYDLQGIEEFKKVVETLKDVSAKTKAVDAELKKTELAFQRIRSGAESLMGTFAKPFTMWYGTATSLYNIYKGLKERSEAHDKNSIKTIATTILQSKKEYDILNKTKTVQHMTLLDRMKMFKTDKKTSTALVGYGATVLGVAGAYGLWGVIPAIIVGVASALATLGLTIGGIGTVTKGLGAVAGIAVGIYAGMHFTDIQGFFANVLGGATSTSDQASQIWGFGLSNITDTSTQTQVNALQAINTMELGTNSVMNALSTLTSYTFSTQLPDIMNKNLDAADKKNNQYYTRIQAVIKSGSNTIGAEFKGAAAYILVYSRSLEKVAHTAESTQTAVENLAQAYKILGGTTGPTLHRISPAVSALSGAMAGLTVGAPIAGGLAMTGIGAPAAGVVLAGSIVAGATYGRFQSFDQQKQDLMTQIQEGKITPEQARDQILSMGLQSIIPWGQTGLEAGGAMAVVHEGEEISSANPKNVSLNLTFNLKASLPSTFTDSELRSLARQVSDYQTQQLYRRQTTQLR